MKRIALPFATIALGAVALTAMRKSPMSAAAPLPARHIGIASGTLARAVEAVVDFVHITPAFDERYSSVDGEMQLAWHPPFPLEGPIYGWIAAQIDRDNAPQLSIRQNSPCLNRRG